VKIYWRARQGQEPTGGPEEGSVNVQGIFKLRVIQERRSMFCEVIVSVIVRKKLHLNMRLIPIGYRDRAVWIHKHKSIITA